MMWFLYLFYFFSLVLLRFKLWVRTRDCERLKLHQSNGQSGCVCVYFICSFVDISIRMVRFGVFTSILFCSSHTKRWKANKRQKYTPIYISGNRRDLCSISQWFRWNRLIINKQKLTENSVDRPRKHQNKIMDINFNRNVSQIQNKNASSN